MGIGKFLIGENNLGGMGRKHLPQHPVGTVANTGFAQAAVKDYLKAVGVGIPGKKQLCRPFRAHGMGGRGAFADFVNIADGFHGNASVFCSFY